MVKKNILLSFFISGFFLVNCNSENNITNKNTNSSENEQSEKSGVRDSITDLVKPIGEYYLTGLIKDLDTSEVLGNVKVFISTDTGEKITVYSDKNGTFKAKFSRPGKIVVTYSLENYQMKILTLNVTESENEHRIHLKKNFTFDKN